MSDVEDHGKAIKEVAQPADVFVLPPVLDTGKAPITPVMTTDKHAVATPVTTAEQDRTTYGQRRINLIWEATQALIALSIIWSSTGAAIWIVISDPMNRLMAFLFLSNVVSIVIGFYFGRTNHQRTGGIGSVDVGR